MRDLCGHCKIVYIAEELSCWEYNDEEKGELVLNANFDIFYELMRRLQSPMCVSGVLGDRDYLFE